MCEQPYSGAITAEYLQAVFTPQFEPQLGFLTIE